MKKQLLISLVGILMLISLAQVGVISATAVSSQQKSQLNAENSNENGAYASPLVIGEGVAAGHKDKDSPIHRAGTVPTALVAQASTATVRVGDTVTASGKLINKNTGAGIPGATLYIQYSFDGNQWTTVANVKTDSNGGVSHTDTIPDPRSFGLQLPLTVYGKVIFAGDETYAATASTYSITVLPP